MRSKYKRPYKKPGALKVAKKALKLAKAATPELKYNDNTLATTPFTITPTVPLFHLSNIAQGDDTFERDGNAVIGKRFTLKASLTSLHASVVSSVIRLVAVMDNQQISDTLPAWSDIFSSQSVHSPYKPDAAGRFKVLKDSVYLLDALQNINKEIRWSVRIPANRVIRYNGVAATDIQKNGVYIYGMVDSATGAASMLGQARLFFRDP